MLSEEKLNRIKELSQKRKTDGLTAEESEERQKLHQEYLESFRKNMRSHIEQIRVYDVEGNDLTPEKVLKLKEEKD